MQFLFFPLCPHNLRALDSAAGSQCLWCLHVSVILSQIVGRTTAGRYSLSGEGVGGRSGIFGLCAEYAPFFSPLLSCEMIRD